MINPVISQYLLLKHPEVYNELAINLKSKPCSLNQLIKIHSFSNQISDDPFYQRLYTICTSLILFSPETIHAEYRVKSGVIKSLAEIMGVSKQALSSKISQSVHYYLNVARVREAVDYIVKEVRGDE